VAVKGFLYIINVFLVKGVKKGVWGKTGGRVTIMIDNRELGVGDGVGRVT
jgi:hypothetical protein